MFVELLGSDGWIAAMIFLVAVGVLELVRRWIVRYRTHDRVPRHKLRTRGIPQRP